LKWEVTIVKPTNKRDTFEKLMSVALFNRIKWHSYTGGNRKDKEWECKGVNY